MLWVPSEWEKHHNNPHHSSPSGEHKSWTSSSEKMFWSESGEKSAQIKPKQSKTNTRLDFDVRDTRRWTFSTEGSVIMDF